jgi:hypothetical protein
MAYNIQDQSADRDLGEGAGMPELTALSEEARRRAMEGFELLRHRTTDRPELGHEWRGSSRDAC